MYFDTNINTIGIKVKQRTIKKTGNFSGIGLHSGKKVEVTLLPAAPNSGINFYVNGIHIKSQFDLVTETTLCTGLNNGNTKLQTIEHFMFALYYLNIDNLTIHINREEMPILDGSSAPFLYILRECGIEEQASYKKFIKIKNKIEVNFEDKYIIAKPSNSQSLKLGIEFEHPVIKSQNIEINQNNFEILESISRARTFGFVEEVEYLRSKNLALGGSLNNAVILDKYKVLNPDGLRMKEEFIFHKALDFLGDTYLEGKNIIADIEGYKTGHHLNNLFMREIFSKEENYEIVTFENKNKFKELFKPEIIFNL